ncbi:MAG TPA: hypothetical protein VGE07_03330 [Herpetosiphonaceae bacterium]
MQWTVTSPTQPDESEVAAIAAALAALIGAEGAAEALAEAGDRLAWEASGKLTQQGLQPARTGVEPRWNTIERLRQRAAGGFYGIVGL